VWCASVQKAFENALIIFEKVLKAVQRPILLPENSESACSLTGILKAL